MSFIIYVAGANVQFFFVKHGDFLGPSSPPARGVSLLRILAIIPDLQKEKTGLAALFIHSPFCRKDSARGLFHELTRRMVAVEPITFPVSVSGEQL